MPDFLYNVPKSVLLHLVRKADRKAGYDDTEVRVSLLLDVDRGDVKSQREYVRLWGQSHKWIRYRWDDIWQDVTRWATSEGRQLDGPLTPNLPPEWLEWARSELGHTKGTAGAQKTPHVEDTGRSGAQQGHTKGTHTSHPSSPSPKTKPPPTPSERWKGLPAALPDWFDAGLWEEWEQYRRETKKALTKTTRSRQMAQLDRFADAGLNPNDALRQSITQGWTGLFPPKQNAKTAPKPKSAANGVDLNSLVSR